VDISTSQAKPGDDGRKRRAKGSFLASIGMFPGIGAVLENAVNIQQ
jgi:hypothetical protein